MTAREIIEQGKARHVPFELDEEGYAHLCSACEQDHPCPDLKAYEALLAILNDALVSVHASVRVRHIPEPSNETTP